MKDIQEIMKEMDDQIGVALDEENTITVEAANEPAKFPLNPPAPACANCSDTAGEFICDTTPSIYVPFACTIALPKGFSFSSNNTNNPRILYDLNCLTAFIEPCFCPGNGLRYAIRVVGCIPYIINLRVSNTGKCVAAKYPDGTTPEIFLCCHDSACVDNTICFACFDTQAYAALGRISDRLSTCGTGGVGVVIDPVRQIMDMSGNIYGAVVSGKFTLPSCNTGA